MIEVDVCSDFTEFMLFGAVLLSVEVSLCCLESQLTLILVVA